MFIYEKKLQFPVKIATPNPKLAAFIISQYGGPDGELGASMRYLSQRYSMPYDEARGLLTDIGTKACNCNPNLNRMFALSPKSVHAAMNILLIKKRKILFLCKIQKKRILHRNPLLHIDESRCKIKY